ncbi:MAG: hypothetical protein AAGH15_01000 [Myxococcota bacterium]
MSFQLLLEAPGVGHGAFDARVRRELVPRLNSLGPRVLRVAHTEAPPPRLAAVPFDRVPAALFSVEAEDPAPYVEALAPQAGERLGAWRVTTTWPLAQERAWAAGARSPGVGLLSTFRRRRGIDPARFLERWHGGHTPLTLEVHPVVGYVRSVPSAPLVPGSAELHGIVEERFARRVDLLDPRRFYGGAWRMVPNALRVAVDIAGFLDLGSVRSWLVAERRVREPQARREP